MDTRAKLITDTLRVLASAEKQMLAIARRAEKLSECQESTKEAYLTIAHAHVRARGRMALYR
jgi:NADP-dependent 3-hydroxy acid dehydrogenase YdfG